ncbi:MCE family protein [Streptomyces sp. KLOTTS4A1]|uniref:MCE family protein n=1 Tax=Streptomyces sp. KLOTTS4A1 TaxID=3390996 RepID=UPI0039F4868C
MTAPTRTPTTPVPDRAPSGPVRTRPGERALSRRRRLAGVVYLLVPALLVWLSIAVYEKEFADTATVVVEVDEAGSEMYPTAEVKLRGVVVGEVERIDSEGSGARLTLAMQREQLGHVPSDVRVRLLPTTLFGQRYVALVAPDEPSPEPLADGAVIPQDRSRNAIELEQVLDNLLPLLTAVKPHELSATLSALAQALEGRGEKLGASMVALDRYLKEFNPQLPALNRNIRELVELSDTYAEVAPDIVDALHDATRTSATLVEQRSELASLYASVTSDSHDVGTWLRRNRANLIRLSGTSRPTLELLAQYAPSFPCTLRTVAAFVPAMDDALGKGTDEPGLHVDVQVVPQRGAYVPGRDAPRYEASGGPRCYPVPYTGASYAPRQTAQTGAPAAVTELSGGLGVANSPQENALVTELLAAETQARPGSLPDWSSVLAGPVLRGTEVSLK